MVASGGHIAGCNSTPHFLFFLFLQPGSLDGHFVVYEQIFICASPKAVLTLSALDTWNSNETSVGFYGSVNVSCFLNIPTFKV